MRIVFFGTANEALPILEELKKQHEILAVVTRPDAAFGRSQALTESPVSSLAKDLNLKTLKPENLKNNPEILTELQNLAADVFVVVAYGKILPIEIINLPKYRAVNIHFALLPKYRGPSPIQQALLNGETKTGTSIFILDEKIDDGPLLAQKGVDIEPFDNYFTLSDKLARISAGLILPTLEDYALGKLAPLPQDETQASYTKIIIKEDGRVNWNKPAGQIYNQFRAFYLWPGIWTVWKEQTLKITECIANTGLPIEHGSTDDRGCGTVIDGGIVICGGGTWLKINRLQLAGKNEVSAEDFLNGYRDFEGSKLG